MSKVGRNAPCPCGSGQKYKNCHMKQEAAAQRDMSVPYGIVALGVVAGIGTAIAASIKFGALVAAASVLVAIGVTAFRDPPAAKEDDGKGASINFGR